MYFNIGVYEYVIICTLEFKFEFKFTFYFFSIWTTISIYLTNTYSLETLCQQRAKGNISVFKRNPCIYYLGPLANFPYREILRNAVVTPLRKDASYEPRIATLGIWGDTWPTRGKHGIYVAVRGSYGALNGSTWR